MVILVSGLFFVTACLKANPPVEKDVNPTPKIVSIDGTLLRFRLQTTNMGSPGGAFWVALLEGRYKAAMRPRRIHKPSDHYAKPTGRFLKQEMPKKWLEKYQQCSLLLDFGMKKLSSLTFSSFGLEATSMASPKPDHLARTLSALAQRSWGPQSIRTLQKYLWTWVKRPFKKKTNMGG